MFSDFQTQGLVGSNGYLAALSEWRTIRPQAKIDARSQAEHRERLLVGRGFVTGTAF
jgi:hypothetical protein